MGGYGMEGTVTIGVRDYETLVLNNYFYYR